MRSDVLSVISSSRFISHVIILTHNIDFIFMQTVVLSAIRRCGNPKITVFADSGCAQESFTQQKDALSELGTRYRVVPCHMGEGYRFHSKAVCLTGHQGGTLLVGSGNLTFGGWLENGEVWTRFENEKDGSGPFFEFKEHLHGILDHVHLPEVIEREVAEAFDSSHYRWLLERPLNGKSLIGRTGSGPALIEKLLKTCGAEPIDELFVCAPYFDRDGVCLNQLVESSRAARTTILCQARSTGLHQRAWGPTETLATLKSVDFKRPEHSTFERSAFLHAKFYAFRRTDSVVVFAGSANCSRAAMTAKGNSGNAELMSLRNLSPQAFKSEFLDELHFSSEPVNLSSELPDDVEESKGPALRILASRFEAGHLLLSFSPSTITPEACIVDNTVSPFVVLNAGVLRVSCTSDPRVVSIHGRMGGVLVRSKLSWIDQEHQLQTTVYSRSLTEHIKTNFQNGVLGADGWADVMEAFCVHLRHMPAFQVSPLLSEATQDSLSVDREFTLDDVFVPGYCVPKLSRFASHSGIGQDDHIRSLQELLLKWFGVETNESKDEDLNFEDIYEFNDIPGNEIVDRPECVNSAQPIDETVTKKNVRRITKILDKLEVAMTSSEFLTDRSPDYLAFDLKMASILLAIGLGKDWIDRTRFFELTHTIWSSLFFARSEGKVGWLEHRALTDDQGDTFRRRMQSTEVSAALIGWYLVAMNAKNRSPNCVRFILAAALSVSRLPWLWSCGGQEDIKADLDNFFVHTVKDAEEHDKCVRSAEKEWRLLNQRAKALQCFECALRHTSFKVIKRRIKVDELVPGDVLWQGKAGFCVVLRYCSRSDKQYVLALRLQDKGGEKLYNPSSVVPIRCLLDSDVLPRTKEFDKEPRKILKEFVCELSKQSITEGTSL